MSAYKPRFGRVVPTIVLVISGLFFLAPLLTLARFALQNVPNLRAAIVSATFLTAAVVMGEYTIANTLLKETLPRFQRTFTGREPQAGYGLNLLALLVTVLLFAILSLVTKKRERSLISRLSRKPT